MTRLARRNRSRWLNLKKKQGFVSLGGGCLIRRLKGSSYYLIPRRRCARRLTDYLRAHYRQFSLCDNIGVATKPT
jgi:hypothetical protein